MFLQRKLLVGVLVLVLSIALIGCGQNLNEELNNLEDNQENENQEGNSEEAGDVENEDDNVLRFAMSGGYSPFNFYDDDNELVGFDVDIGREVTERMGYEYEPVTTAWDGIIAGLQSGHYDGIWGSMAITEEREERVDFSDPYYYSGAQLVVRADSDYESIEDLPEDARIGIVVGTTFEEIAEEYGETVGYEDDGYTLNELENGRVEAVITDRLVAIKNIEEHGYDFELAGELLYTEEMAVAVQKGNDELLEEINEALAEVIEDGTYHEINDKWFPGYDLLEQ